MARPWLKSNPLLLIAVALLLFLWTVYYSQGTSRDVIVKDALISLLPYQSKKSTPFSTTVTGSKTTKTCDSIFTESSSASPLGHHGTPTSLRASATTQASYSPRETPIILYAYSDSSWALENLRFFLTHGLHGSATFIFIVNGAIQTLTDLDPTDLPESLIQGLDLLERYRAKFSNVKIIKRPNTCYDLGAYGAVLLNEHAALYRSHRSFILINASLRGPFVPMWSRECWSDAYLHPIISGSADAKGKLIKLVGMTMNCASHVPNHIQSMLLATDDVGMGILLGVNSTTTKNETVGLGRCPTNMESAIQDIELRLTDMILDSGYSVRAMMALAWSQEGFVENCTIGDVNAAAGAYEGGDLDVWETMFIKTRWAVGKETTDRISKWLDQSVLAKTRNGSWDYCK